MAEDFHQGKKRRKPHLVVRAGDAFLKLGEPGFLPTSLYDFARDGNLDAKELVALSVLAGPCLEKAHQPFDL